MKRAIFLATAALLAMLILVPIAMAQDTTMITRAFDLETTMIFGEGEDGVPESGGPTVVLPAAALLLGSGILTYAFLRRR